MRSRNSRGGVAKQRGRWRGHWYENGIKKSRVVGLCSEISKGEAREAVAKIVAQRRASKDGTRFGEFVEGVFFGFMSRKWKASTREENLQRIRFHLVSIYKDVELAAFRRDGLQDLLDAKAKSLSFSVVDHIRWDLKAIFDMAIAEGLVLRNPALLLFTPKEAKHPIRRAMNVEQVQLCFAVLAQRERLIARLAILAGMRPGEIFGLRWERLTADHADIRQRVYRGLVDTPKTNQSYRKAALADGLVAEIEAWRLLAIDPTGWVFPSEAMTPLSKDNCFRRNMLPKLKAVGLEWCNFQVMRRTHTTIMRQMGADPKMVADQLGHSVDVSLNVYAQSSVASRLPIVNQLEKRLAVQ
jgi:integrase